MTYRDPIKWRNSRNELTISMDELGERIAKLGAERDRALKAVEFGWVVIANAYGGDWKKAHTRWRQAATRWRDEYLHLVEGEIEKRT